MKQTEREITTKRAVKKIQALLDAKDFATAILLSSIYVHLRMKSLLTDRLQGPEKNWKRIQQTLSINFRAAVRLCDTSDLLRGHDPKKLQKLCTIRNRVAHESDLWRSQTEEERKDISECCKSTISFLKATSD